MRIAAISANLGSYDPPHPWVEQAVPDGVTLDVYRLTDADLPPRPLAMTSRLQCGIPKMWGWQMFPGYDAILWVDASCALTDQYSVARWLEWLELRDNELVVFEHPDRHTIESEVAFMKARMARPGETYLTSRYKDEWIDDLYAHICDDEAFSDTDLYASTAFMYRPTPNVTAMLKDWWAAKARWCLHDQIYWPYTIWKHKVDRFVIQQNYTKCPTLLEYVRNKR